ncbi:DUF2939 domain-containing protein [Massilia glaciei]|uniref:DUF2939 domain-containing protein n=1 Tax=Massilia glaciei TaxID=1524097 RepID=A0A2U2HLV4_9BURK|nr:DUF2939 domain-containing protein [Massilia glaciei]PWF48422.1 DUF2939 domain-containing protein [Massilia glaciei]
MTSKSLKSLLVVALVAVAAYWYWSPFLALWQLKSAARENDAAAFNERIDFPKVRDSLKSQFSAMFEERLPAAGDLDDPRAKAGAAFGARLGAMIVNKFVDTMVRPETIMRAMQDGRLTAPGAAAPGTQPSGEAGGQAQATKPKLEWTYEREGVNKLVAYATDPQKPTQTNDEKLGLVLERSGFAQWRLTEVRLSGMPQRGAPIAVTVYASPPQ